MVSRRLGALGAAAVGTTLLVAVVLQHTGHGRKELLSGADAEAARQVQRRGATVRQGIGEGGSQLADLIDSPLMLAKQKIDHYLNEDSDNLVEEARKMNVVGSKKGGAPCTSLKCDDGVWQNDYLQASKNRLEKVSSPSSAGFPSWLLAAIVIVYISQCCSRKNAQHPLPHHEHKKNTHSAKLRT